MDRMSEPGKWGKWIFIGILTALLAISLFTGEALRGSFGYVTPKGVLIVDGLAEYSVSLPSGSGPFTSGGTGQYCSAISAGVHLR